MGRTRIDEYPLGERIRYMRARRGFTQGELAKKCRVSQGLISQIEKSQVTPSVDTLRAIATALDTHISRFFEGDNVVVLEMNALKKRYKNFASLPDTLRERLQVIADYLDQIKWPRR